MDDLWENDPPAPTEFAGLRLIRVGTARELECVITSDALTGRQTHFWKRRTTPCTGPDCPACIDAVPARWHGYVSAISSRTKAQFVLELTALAAHPIAEYLKRKGTLRGAMLVARRIGSKPNSPVTCVISPCDCDLRTLPRAVHMKKFLCTVWNLAFDDAPTEATTPDEPHHAGPPEPTDDDFAEDRLRFPIHAYQDAIRKSNGKL